MPKTTHRLNAISASNIKKPGLYPDGAGLYLRVKPSGARSWVYRYMHDRKPRYLGLGSVASVSLATARSLAGDARRQLDLGQDPIEAKRAAEREAAADKARLMLFKECAEAYMAAHEPSWKNAKHCEQWHSTLRRYLYPKFGGVAVSLVTTEMVLDAIQPIWHSMPETASRVRGRIEVVIDWAKARGAFSGENPARWRGHLANLLPKPSKVARVEHHAAMPFDNIPAFMSELRAATGLTPRGAGVHHSHGRSNNRSAGRSMERDRAGCADEGRQGTSRATIAKSSRDHQRAGNGQTERVCLPWR